MAAKKARTRVAPRRASKAKAKTRSPARRNRAPKLDDVIDLPPMRSFNQNLRSASERTMLSLLGVPGRKTKRCSSATGEFRSRVVSDIDVGPFKVTGLNVAVAFLKDVFAEAKEHIPEVVARVKTAGMLCVRHKHGNTNSFSNHSWGAAIDLFFGADVVDQGRRKTHRGNLLLAPFFNKHGWYWGAGFSGQSVDSMHFELAEQTIRNALG